ncbi:MAG: sporulation transcriptional regulator SpoIIID [Lachnospiraceae bacterium]
MLNWTPADVTQRLPALQPSLYDEVRNVLDTNKAQRHIRGGLATKQKYLQQRQESINIWKKDR